MVTGDLVCIHSDKQFFRVVLSAMGDGKVHVIRLPVHPS